MAERDKNWTGILSGLLFLIPSAGGSLETSLSTPTYVSHRRFIAPEPPRLPAIFITIDFWVSLLSNWIS